MFNIAMIIMAILPGIFINGVDVGKLEADEARVLLEAAFDASDKRLVLRTGDDVFSYSFADFGAAYDFGAALSQAVEFSEDGGFFALRRKKKGLKANPLRINAEFVWDAQKVQAAADGIAAAVNTPSLEPSYRIENRQFVFEQGQVGRDVDANALAIGIEGILRRRLCGEFTAKVTTKAPKLRDEDFTTATQLLGSFTTPFDPSNASRATNLAVASAFLNNTVILPGEVMSTCAVLRPRKRENGYVEAGQIIGGLPDTGIGGGICQISSTLYMAALQAEMGIVERQAHSLMVSYMQPSTDATIAEGLIDLKIKNNTGHQVKITARVSDGECVVEIMRQP